MKQSGRLGNDERGFTLPEVLITTILLGILFTIATSTWFGVVESRNGDSAANQLAADLRLAHTSATNRLVPWRVVLTADIQNYQLIRQSSPTVTTVRSLPDGMEIGTTITVQFAADGSASVVSGSGNPISVRSTDDSPQHTIGFNTSTSRIEIDP